MYATGIYCKPMFSRLGVWGGIMCAHRVPGPDVSAQYGWARLQLQREGTTARGSVRANGVDPSRGFCVLPYISICHGRAHL
mmetsp:Transcript_5782/g.12166  ORF Transcript_5782/g.12166 Transcript_5782/m.12166 type:complete len:81 (+) Transcript_5782:261-503(+)